MRRWTWTGTYSRRIDLPEKNPVENEIIFWSVYAIICDPDILPLRQIALYLSKFLPTELEIVRILHEKMKMRDRL